MDLKELPVRVTEVAFLIGNKFALAVRGRDSSEAFCAD